VCMDRPSPPGAWLGLDVTVYDGGGTAHSSSLYGSGSGSGAATDGAILSPSSSFSSSSSSLFRSKMAAAMSATS